MNLEEKRAHAVAYLEYRDKRVAMETCRWRPTSAAKTDVRKTMRAAQREIVTVERRGAAPTPKEAT